MKHRPWSLSCPGHVALALAIGLSGCMAGWRTAALAPAQVIREEGPTEIQVKRTDGSVLYLRDPAVTDDSIIGWQSPPWNEGGPMVRQAVAAAEVRQIGVRGPENAVNVFLGVVIGWLAFGVLFGLSGGAGT